MFGRVIAIAVAFLLAAFAAGPLLAEPALVVAATSLGRDASSAPPDKAPGKSLPDVPTGATWLQHAMPAILGDKAIRVEKTTLVLLRTEAGEGARVIGKLFLILVRYSIDDVATVAAAPEYCALAECAALAPDTVAEVADRARLSIERQLESGRGTLSSGKETRRKDTAYRFEEVAGPTAGETSHEPAAVMNPPAPWWHDWVTPTTVLGLLGTLIAGFSTWFAVQHQRHQMQREQLQLAAAAAAPAAPLAPAPMGDAAPKRSRSRSRSGASATPSVGSRRSRSSA